MRGVASGSSAIADAVAPRDQRRDLALAVPALAQAHRRRA